jgi:hypothetical protein
MTDNTTIIVFDDESNLEVEADNSDETIGIQEYSITSYGVDYDVEGIVKRLKRGDIAIPEFQRDFVWEQTRASRFIESLLMGLPVPGVFLYKDEESQKLLVIDGQQRLRTLQFFYSGRFGLISNKVFRLRGLETRFEGLSYEDLADEDRRRLDDSIIHATVVRQDLPDDTGTSQYFVFERLNTGAKPLVPQEIRAAIYSGPFNELLTDLNKNSDWRTLFGNVSKRKRDEELILRFLSLYYSLDQYSPPMKGFLNKFMMKNRDLNLYNKTEILQLFDNTVSTVVEKIGEHAFKPKRAVNAAVLDAVMIGVGRRLQAGPIKQDMVGEYDKLLKDADFLNAIAVSTADTDNVNRRIRLATEAFSQVE